MAMTRLPKGTGAGKGQTTLAATSQAPQAGVTGHRPAQGSGSGKAKKMVGTKPITKVSSRAKVSRGGGNSVVPRTTWPNSNKTNPNPGFGPDKASAGKKKVGGPISSGGGSFGQND